jgi:hypothetical protein
MPKTSKTRAALDQCKVETTKSNILDAALRVAATRGGWTMLTRKAVALEAGCAEARISQCFGTMLAFRRTIMRHAVINKNLAVIAQGIVAGDKYADAATPELKKAALITLS